MKKLLFFFLFTVLSLSGLEAQNILGTSDSATLIFVRHAEKADDGTRNPPLTKEGEARAERIKTMLKKAYSKVDAIYSTEYKRTQSTALPTSKEFDLDIQSYDPRASKVFIKKILKDHQGEVVLIVGHSNTTPFLVNMIIGEDKFAQLDESAYDDVFIVKSKEVGKGEIQVKSSAKNK